MNPTSSSGQPNILFVFTDQQTRQALGAAGNPYVRTPHMNALARQGVLFQQAYCAAPVCAPSRASMLTGRMPHETGVEYNGPAIPPQFPTLGEVFRTAGYDTAWIGPWHLSEYHPADPNGTRGFRNLIVPPLPNLNFGTCIDERIAARAVAFLEAERARPFLLAASLLNPHDICYWITGWQAERLHQFRPTGALPPLPPNFERDQDEPEFVQLCRQREHYGDEQQRTRDWDETQWRTYLAVYYRLVEQVDAQLGRLVAAVPDDTVILFTSDHGEGVAAHRWVVKLMLYEEEAGVPFIISRKGQPTGGRVDRTTLVSGIDVLPTLCDCAGIQPPPGLHGRSLRPILENRPPTRREFVVTELAPDPARLELKGRMLRTARFKYIVFSHGQRPELLFDLDHDPGETNNLSAQPAFRDELLRHRALLAGWVRETGDPFRTAGSV